MKPLNRPMFRYGGPIKEGVMSGIREPKKDGNIVGGHQSPKLAGAHPLKDASGREHHFIPAFLGLNALRTGAMALGRRAVPKIANFFRTQVGSKTPGSVKIPGEAGTAGRFLPKNVKTVPKSGPNQPIYEPNYLGRDPLVRAAGGLYNTITSPTAKGIGAKVVRFATSPSSIIAGTAYYLWPDGKERTTPPPLGDSGRRGTSGAPGGGDPGMYSTPQGDASKKGGDEELSAEELRKERIQKYRDIMDIKGMNKDAAYNSLIAASQAINESGDFKGDIKSGKLINQIIQATSKQFDKPKQTKDAIDTLILKGEIDKDIKASDPSAKLLNEYRLKQMEKIDKDLNTGFAEAKIAASKNLSGQSAIDAAASVASENFKGNLLTKTQLTDVMEAAKGSGEISEQDIIISATTEVIKGKNLPDGDYTVGDVLVTITEGQVTNIKR